MSIILYCICYLPRDSLGLGTILGYSLPNIDIIFIQLTSGHFTSFFEQLWMIGLLEDMLESLSDTSSES